MAAKKSYSTELMREGNLTAIPVPFDPKALFGKVRAPVKVTINGYTYRSTIAAMGGTLLIPLRKSNRDAARLTGDEKSVRVTLELDTDERTVEPPSDLVRALKAAKAWEQWSALSYTHQREHVEAIESAKKPETRARRIEAAVTMVKARPMPKKK